jgi:probable F420-dependent oxidoreductase
MKVGLAVRDMRTIVERARRAEELGFDYLATGEHVFFHGPTPNTFVTLAAAAAVTERIELLSAVALAPLYPAALLAKLAVSVDVVSNGRFNLGLGVGGEFAPEFAALGVPTAERGARMDEALEVCRRLFGAGRVDFEGQWSNISGLRLNPPPVRAGGPPIWTAGRNERSLVRAGRYADVWMPYMVTPERLAGGLREVRKHAVAAGRDAEDVAGALFGFISIDEDGDRARTWAADIVGATYQQDFAKLGRYLIAGTPEDCARRMSEFHQAGASSIHVLPAVPPTEEERCLTLIATQVLPALHAANSVHAQR